MTMFTFETVFGLGQKMNTLEKLVYCLHCSNVMAQKSKFSNASHEGDAGDCTDTLWKPNA